MKHLLLPIFFITLIGSCAEEEACEWTPDQETKSLPLPSAAIDCMDVTIFPSLESTCVGCGQRLILNFDQKDNQVTTLVFNLPTEKAAGEVTKDNLYLSPYIVNYANIKFVRSLDRPFEDIPAKNLQEDVEYRTTFDATIDLEMVIDQEFKCAGKTLKLQNFPVSIKRSGEVEFCADRSLPIDLPRLGH